MRNYGKAVLQTKLSSKHHRQVWDPLSADAVLGDSGAPLASGYFAVIWIVKGDLGFFAKGFNLAHYNSNAPCPFCPCEIGGQRKLWPSNFAATAAWKSRMFSAATWRAAQTNLHAMFVKFNFLSQHSVEADELHILHLGFLQWMLGSCLWDLVYVVLPGSPTANMANIWMSISRFYSANGSSCQFSTINLSSFTNSEHPRSDYPRLKGRGGEIKHVLPAMVECWESMMRDGNQHDLNVGEMLTRILEIQDLIDQDPQAMFMSPGDSMDFRSKMDDVLQIYTRLATEADREHNLLWNVTPKLHWAWHFAHKSQYLHPRRGACWIDEDLVGKMKEICKSCVHGTPLYKIPNTVAIKYHWAMFVRRL